MPELEKFDLTVVPFGFCPECLERVIKGREYEAIPLVGGARLAHAYCSHREVGGALILRSGKPQRWALTVPIDAIEWRKMVLLRAAAYAGVQQGFRDRVDAAADSSG